MRSAIDVRAATFDDEIPDGALVLHEVTSRAFGDGSHPTTRLSARAVDFYCRGAKKPRVLDVGTGTGVLARVARAHGSTTIVATEIDAASRRAAQTNIALDDDDVRIDVVDEDPFARGETYDLVVANIISPVLTLLSSSLIRAVAPGGHLVLSGFTAIEIPAHVVTFARAGEFEMVSKVTDGEWALLVWTKRA